MATDSKNCFNLEDEDIEKGFLMVLNKMMDVVEYRIKYTIEEKLSIISELEFVIVNYYDRTLINCDDVQINFLVTIYISILEILKHIKTEIDKKEDNGLILQKYNSLLLQINNTIIKMRRDRKKILTDKIVAAMKSSYSKSLDKKPRNPKLNVVSPKKPTSKSKNPYAKGNDDVYKDFRKKLDSSKNLTVVSHSKRHEHSVSPGLTKTRSVPGGRKNHTKKRINF